MTWTHKHLIRKQTLNDYITSDFNFQKKKKRRIK